MEEKTVQDEFKWSVCPAKKHPRRVAFVRLVDLGFGALIASNSLILGICMAGVLIATQATFLFTSRFSIDEEGIRAKYPFRKKVYTWKQIHRVKFFNEACYLFTRKKPSNLDGWSGLTVFYGEDRDEIIRVVKSHLEPDIAT